MTKARRFLDIDQWLVFFLLAVTVNQMGHYLAAFAPPGLAFVGYLQAVAIDCAIWRSAYWFRRYGGRRQRRWAAFGVVAFSLVSAWYNRNYYAMRMDALGSVVPWLMGAALPLGVALLSYLHGMKDESRFAADRSERQEREPGPQPVVAPVVLPFTCVVCGREFTAQNGLNAHQRSHNGHRDAIPLAARR